MKSVVASDRSAWPTTATKLIANIERGRNLAEHMSDKLASAASRWRESSASIRSSKIIAGAFKLAYNEIFQKKIGHANGDPRTQTDIKMLLVVIMILLTALMIFVFFFGGVVFNFTHALVGMLIVIIVAFLFTTVAANATALVGTNPVSGMTLMTLILSSFILVQIGLSGATGMLSVSHHWRRCLHGAFCRRRIHHRFESRLLDRHDAEKTRDMEISRGAYFRGNSWRCYHGSQQNLWLQRRRCNGCATGKCNGGSYSTADVEHTGSVDFVFSRRSDLVDFGDGEYFASCLCAWNVHPARIEYTTGHRWNCFMVGHFTFEE